jgi:hypothetical protein
MPNKFASGKYAIAQCDRCGFRFKLKQLRQLVVKTKKVNILVCGECWEEDHPQLQLGMYPVNDPQAVRNPRTDTNSYYQSGYTGMQLTDQIGSSNIFTGVPADGNRVIGWGWNPVGGPRDFDALLTPNLLVGLSVVNNVTIT